MIFWPIQAWAKRIASNFALISKIYLFVRIATFRPIITNISDPSHSAFRSFFNAGMYSDKVLKK